MICALSPTRLIPWFSKLREILTLLCCITHSSSREKTNASSRGSRNNFWRRCRGDICQAKTHQVPIINSHPSHYIIFHSPLVFLSPTSKMIFEKNLPFLRPFFRSIFCWLELPCAFFLLASSLAKSLWIPIYFLIFLKGPILMNQLLVS